MHKIVLFKEKNTSIFGPTRMKIAPVGDLKPRKVLAPVVKHKSIRFDLTDTKSIIVNVTLV